jgi:general secretion pathway protein H
LGIRFFPSGASTGGSIKISEAERSLTVSVDWLTGKVAIHGPE